MVPFSVVIPPEERDKSLALDGDGTVRSVGLRACRELVSTTPSDNRHPESIRICADHPTNGLYCPECWRHHGGEHHARSIPDCAQCGAPQGGIWTFGAMAPVKPTRIRSMTGDRREVVLTGRIRVEPTACVCTPCQEALLAPRSAS